MGSGAQPAGPLPKAQQRKIFDQIKGWGEGNQDRTYKVAVLQPQKLLRAHVLVRALVVGHDALAVSCCLSRFAGLVLCCVVTDGGGGGDGDGEGEGDMTTRRAGTRSRSRTRTRVNTSTEHLAAATANFSIGLARPEIVGIAQPKEKR